MISQRCEASDVGSLGYRDLNMQEIDYIFPLNSPHSGIYIRTYNYINVAMAYVSVNWTLVSLVLFIVVSLFEI